MATLIMILRMMRLKLFQCSFFVLILLCNPAKAGENLTPLLSKLTQTIKILAKGGYCIDQIHQSGKFLIATKNRTYQNKLWIKMFDNHPVHLVESHLPFQVLGGGVGGFCWTNTDLQEVHFFRLINKEKYTWILKKSMVKDCKMYEKGDVIYYKYSEKENVAPLYGILYCLTNDHLHWQDVSPNYAVSYLNDSFHKYQFINKTNNYLLIDSNNDASAVILLQNNKTEIFGNNFKCIANTATINHTNTSICIRDKNDLLIYDLISKKNTVLKPLSTLASSETNNSVIKFFMFSLCNNYILIFYEKWACTYNIESGKMTKSDLPQRFKAIHSFPDAMKLLFQSNVDKLYVLSVNSESIEYNLL